MINYSIIIPHHNVPRLLQRLLDSIPKRDDLEIIIVDDNSTPDKVDFSKFPGKERYNCKFIFDKKGGGGGYARNLGLEQAKGEWLIFADADDFFMPYFNEALDYYLNSEADIIFFNAASLDSDLYRNMDRAEGLDAMIRLHLKNPNLAEQRLEYLFHPPWCKFFKHSMILEHNIRFDETAVSNDVAFSYLAGYYATKVEVDQHALYCVTARGDSVSARNTFETRKVRIRVAGQEAKFYQQHNINVGMKEHFSYAIDELVENHNLQQFWVLVKIIKNLNFTYSELLCGLSRDITRRIVHKLINFPRDFYRKVKN